jgi:acyl dehydratase
LTPANRPNIADLPRGHELPLADFRLDAAAVRRYLEAVEDRSGAYGQGPEGPAWLPPLAVAALALRAIMGQVELPAGALHTGQEVEFRRPVPVGASLRSQARVAQRSEMRGAVISVIEFEVTEEGSSTPVVVGRATVMIPPGEASP